MSPKIQWPLVMFSLLAGIGGCLFTFACAADMLGESSNISLIVTIISFALVCIGGLFSVAHLATPRHAWAVITHIFSFSGISVELIMLGVTCLFMLGFIYCIFFGAPVLVKLSCALLGAAAGIYLAFATGHGYLISSKPTWNTMKLPISYMSTSLIGGSLLYLSIAGIIGASANASKYIAYLSLLCGCINVFALVAYIIHLGPIIAKTNKKLYGLGIVSCNVAASLVFPALLCLLALLVSGNSALFTLVSFTGFACAFAGGLSLRMLMWIVGAGFLSLFDHARAHRSVILNQ